jgi:hypothetical protein
MTAAQVVMDEALFWALVGLGILAAFAALVAAVAALSATRQTRTALAQLETARQEVVVPDREWQERSPIPRRASDAAFLTEPPAPVPPPRDATEPMGHVVRPAVPPIRRSESLDDPDRPGPSASAHVGADPASLRTEPAIPPRAPAVMAAPPAPQGGHAAQARTTEITLRASGSQAVIGAPMARPVPTSPAEPEPRPPASVGSPVPLATPAPVVPSTPAEPPSQPPADPTAARLRRLQDPDPFVRIEAMEQLRDHPALVEALLRSLHDDYPVVRRQAVRSLKEAGGPQATRALLDVANQDPSAEVREEAVGALAAMLSDNRRPSAEAAGETEA